ncbi:DegT/DnrJ/EryC1/StrS family aminotransferase [Lysobacter enzymogenes]|jgi:dTDP-4-amino-4,6-dideoxygalactose transaminase|uniref:DegT/DnrJ/EryC1/StrS family aminotransferase n=1 Tax=Lysobacter enzymogenes TaxID=69 RepID=UPI00089446AB|nr:DegT/DnrJ/EryC1/StrS family aminotransferase [Lysobacter enzymogenes]SDW23551.1 dTDP-4-amino-4,6-dideoxygalactose transaminase [Lysobacter enzymogenes]
MTTIPLLVPHMPQAESLMPYLRQIDHNRHYTNFGPLNAEFERRIAADVGRQWLPEQVTTVSNCTVGLELALQALGLRTGARVLIPAITFAATVTAVLRVGMQPVLSDVDRDSWLLSPQLARSALADGGIDAVIPVSTFGCPQDPLAWDAFVRETSVPVLVDAAGAYGNQGPGEDIDVVYSFHATKSFGAAEGGAVLSRSTERIKRIRKLSNFGIDTSIAMLDSIGTNGKMSEYHCAIGLASFDQWEQTKRDRRDLSARYARALAERCPYLGYQDKPADGIYPLMPVLLPAGASAARWAEGLATLGIQTRRWYSPSLHNHPALHDVAKAGALEVAVDIGERILGIPFFIGMTDEHIARVCDALDRVRTGQGEAP